MFQWWSYLGVLPEPLWKVIFLHFADSLWREMWRGERTRCEQCSGSCSGGDECEVHCNDISCVYLMEGSNLAGCRRRVVAVWCRRNESLALAAPLYSQHLTSAAIRERWHSTYRYPTNAKHKAKSDLRVYLSSSSTLRLNRKQLVGKGSYLVIP